MAGGLTKFGNQLVQLQVGPRIHVAAPEGSKSPFGVRAAVIFVFPKNSKTEERRPKTEDPKSKKKSATN